MAAVAGVDGAGGDGGGIANHDTPEAFEREDIAVWVVAVLVGCWIAWYLSRWFVASRLERRRQARGWQVTSHDSGAICIIGEGTLGLFGGDNPTSVSPVDPELTEADVAAVALEFDKIDSTVDRVREIEVDTELKRKLWIERGEGDIDSINEESLAAVDRLQDTDERYLAIVRWADSFQRVRLLYLYWMQGNKLSRSPTYWGSWFEQEQGCHDSNVRNLKKANMLGFLTDNSQAASVRDKDGSWQRPFICGYMHVRLAVPFARRMSRQHGHNVTVSTALDSPKEPKEMTTERATVTLDAGKPFTFMSAAPHPLEEALECAPELKPLGAACCNSLCMVHVWSRTWPESVDEEANKLFSDTVASLEQVRADEDLRDSAQRLQAESR